MVTSELLRQQEYIQFGWRHYSMPKAELIPSAPVGRSSCSFPKLRHYNDDEML
jgi:hypothetical protein